jgi:hypothetical protein
MLITFDFVDGANKDICFVTIELNVSVLGHWWFIFAHMPQIGTNYFKGSEFLFQGGWRQNVNLQSRSIMSQLSMHSRPEWTWHLLEGIWPHFYQQVPGYSFIKTCFLVTRGCAYTFLFLYGPLASYQYSRYLPYQPQHYLKPNPNPEQEFSTPQFFKGWEK